jgi:uncharacterized protein (TIGR03118 family)
MKHLSRSRDYFNPRKDLLFILFLLVFSAGCQKFVDNKLIKQDITQVNLVSNNWNWNPAHFDSSLINAWGLAWAPSGIAWVNSEAGHVSELYSGEGVSLRAGVNIPSPLDLVGGSPTGVVFNNVPGFTLADGKPANFLFDGVDAVLSGWNGTAGANAFRIGVAPAKSSYTGLTLAASKGINYLYAANFGAGRIDVWDTGFTRITWMPFHDPNLPSGFSPFNIQSIGTYLYVTYAKVGPMGRDQAGVGNGFVDIFNTDGAWFKRFASKNFLNSPWGIVETPANFLVNVNGDNDNGDNDGNNSGNNNNGNGNSGNGNSGNGNNGNGGNGNSGNGNGSPGGPGNSSGGGSYYGGNNGNGNSSPGGPGGKQQATGTNPVILVGNFGDGRINVYTLDGNFLGLLATNNHLLVIDGLWALSFPPSTSSIDPGRLYFTAGPNGGKDGLFGYLINQ